MTQAGQSRIYTEQQRGTSNKQTTQVWASGAQVNVQGGASMHFAAGAALKVETTADFTSGTLKLPGTLAKGYIPLPLLTARGKATATASGVVALTTGSLPALVHGDVTGGPLRVRWTTGLVEPLYFGPIAVPDDLSTAGGLGIRIKADRISGSATGTSQEFFVHFFDNLSTASGGFTTIAYSTNPAETSAAIASGSVPATGFFTVALKPGAHASVEVYLYNAGLTYTKKTS